MISIVTDTVEALIRKLQSDVTPNTVLVPLNDYYEIKQVPSLLVIGPKMEENRAKRVSEKIVEIDQDSLSYTERNWPRFYHLDFDFLSVVESKPAPGEKERQIVREVKGRLSQKKHARISFS